VNHGMANGRLNCSAFYELQNQSGIHAFCNFVVLSCASPLEHGVKLKDGATIIIMRAVRL